MEYSENNIRFNIKTEVVSGDLIIEIKEGEDEKRSGNYKGIFNLTKIKSLNKMFKMYDSVEEFKTDFLDKGISNKKIKLTKAEDKLKLELNFVGAFNENQTAEFELILIEEKPEDLIKKLSEKVRQLEEENKELKEEIKKIKEGKNSTGGGNLNVEFSQGKSKILEDKDIELINAGITSRLSKRVKGLKKIYDAKVDGDKASDFHSHCDNIANTLTLIHSDQDYKYGGFTTQTWNDIYDYKDDKNAFVFSLNKRKIYGIKNDEKAIYCKDDFGPTFGGGHDILVRSDFLKEANSCTETFIYGHSYDGSDYQLGPYNDRTWIKLVDLEVFEVILADI
ncbi:MAG: TLD domain-containing protein [archaeon]|nr:TLD domain-containing protein [archaeon]